MILQKKLEYEPQEEVWFIDYDEGKKLFFPQLVRIDSISVTCAKYANTTVSYRVYRLAEQEKEYGEAIELPPYRLMEFYSDAEIEAARLNSILASEGVGK